MKFAALAHNPAVFAHKMLSRVDKELVGTVSTCALSRKVIYNEHCLKCQILIQKTSTQKLNVLGASSVESNLSCILCPGVQGLQECFLHFESVPGRLHDVTIASFAESLDADFGHSKKVNSLWHTSIPKLRCRCQHTCDHVLASVLCRISSTVHKFTLCLVIFVQEVLDGAEIVTRMHNKGIPVRMMGAVWGLLWNECARKIVMTEMIARLFKVSTPYNDVDFLSFIASR